MFNRREFLKLAATAGASTLASRYAFAQSDVLRMASANPMSGPFATNGLFADIGMRLAIDTYGKVLGKGIIYTVVDTEGKPATALRKTQEEIRNGTHFFVGGILTPDVLAAGKEITNSNSLQFVLSGSDEVTGTECNRGTFRWPMPSYGAINRTVRPLLEKMPHAKRWYTITPRFIFGEGMLSAAKAVFQDTGIEHVGNSYHAMAEKEYSGHLTNAMAARPDVLLVLGFGAPSSDVIRQAASFGMKSKTTILLAWASGLEQFQALGADVCDGVYFGAQYWHGIDTATNKEFVKLVNAKLDMDPNYSLAGSYQCTKIVLDAIVKANSIDAGKVIKTLEGMEYDGLTGRERVRADDHQVIKNYYLLKGKNPSEMADKNDYAEIVTFGQAYRSVEETGCQLT